MLLLLLLLLLLPPSLRFLWVLPFFLRRLLSVPGVAVESLRLLHAVAMAVAAAAASALRCFSACAALALTLRCRACAAARIVAAAAASVVMSHLSLKVSRARSTLKRWNCPWWGMDLKSAVMAAVMERGRTAILHLEVSPLT